MLKPCYHAPFILSRDTPMRFAFITVPAGLLFLAACSVISPAPESEEGVQASPQPAQEKSVTRPFPEDSFIDLLVAEFSMRRLDFETALDNYAYQAKQTNDKGVVSTAARLAQYLDREDEALNLAQQWVALEPDNAEALFALSSALTKNAQPVAALNYMRRVLDQGGEANFAALAASALSLPEDEQQTFITQIDALRKEHPNDASLKIAKSLLLQYQEEEEQALSLIREVLDEEPDNAHALLIETRTLAQMGNTEEAQERLRYAVDQNPANKRLRHDLARSLVNNKLYEAKAQYQVLVKQNPNDDDLLLELMLINRELDNTTEAASQLEELQDNTRNSSRVNYILGRIAEEEQQWLNAIKHYQQATGPREFDLAIRRIAAISMATEGNDNALNRMASLRQEHPQKAEDLYLLSAEILRKSAQFQEGFALLSTAINQHPNNVDLRYSRSLFAENLGKIDIVEQDLLKIISDDPDNAAALNALGYTLANRTDRLDEAEAFIKKAIDLKPDDAAIIDSYGWVLFLKGEVEDAVVILERAFAKSQDHEIAAHFGEALWHSGKEAEAKEVFKRGLENTPNSSIIMDTLQRLQLLNEE